MAEYNDGSRVTVEKRRRRRNRKTSRSRLMRKLSTCFVFTNEMSVRQAGVRECLRDSPQFTLNAEFTQLNNMSWLRVSLEHRNSSLHFFFIVGIEE